MTITLSMAKQPDDITRAAAIPLCDLVAWEGNVRKTADEAALAELAASIAAHGLLQSLVVRQRDGGDYEVIAGKRRLRALLRLVEAGQLTTDARIDCHVITAEDDADEISLAENVVRESMHPADECAAFKSLNDRGVDLAGIAARFGVSETVVKKRLLLANLAPEILAAFREGKLSLAMVQAFAASDDHARQLQVFKDMRDDDDPSDIRERLTEGRIPATDKRVKCITLAAYEQAGGIVSRDLFSTDDSGIFIEDAALLDRLVLQRLEAEAQAMRAQGWSWADITLDSAYKYADKHSLKEVYPDHRPKHPGAEKEVEALEEEAEKIYEDSKGRDYTPEERARLEEIHARIDTLSETVDFWTDDLKPHCGMVLSLGWHGGIKVNAYRRPEAGAEKKKAKNADKTPGAPDDPEDGPADGASPHELPRALIRSLTEHRQVALAAELSGKIDLALAVAVHSLGSDILYDDFCDKAAALEASDKLDTIVDGDDAASSPAFSAMAQERAAWAGQIPEEVEGFWDWCLAQKRQKLLNLLGYLVSCTVDAATGNMHRLAEADALAEALGLDMTKYFTPTAKNYFSHVGKITILANLCEAHGLKEVPAAWQNLPHDKLAELAEREIAGTGWLPEPLRAPPMLEADDGVDGDALEEEESDDENP